MAVTPVHGTGSVWNMLEGNTQEVLDYMSVSGLMPSDIKGITSNGTGSIIVMYFKCDL